jgi:hypothetical protein
VPCQWIIWRGLTGSGRTLFLNKFHSHLSGAASCFFSTLETLRISNGQS